MIAFKINTVKTLMNDLLVENKFDDFLVTEATITTYNTFSIDGHLNKSFYTEEEYEQLSEKELSSWQTIRPICFSLIKGHKTPTKFKIVLALSKKEISTLLESNHLEYLAHDINGFYLNLVYSDNTLTCTTGTSLKVFSLDKTTENLWDKYVNTLFSSYETI